jgi:hypothetical protein
MRKIECACGISIDIYSWPSAEVEQNDKKMMERHIRCRCNREIVVRTPPKYEPDFEPAEDEKISTVASFAEISRQFGVLKEAEPHNKPLSGDVADEAPPTKTMSISEHESDLLTGLVANYGRWFKQGKASAADQKKFMEFAQRILDERGKSLILSEEECRMCKMAFSERNLFHIYPGSAPDDVAKDLESLRLHIKEILE